ncbi:tRNA-specific adenosine deaminase [Deinococcus carri]|uniref:tRNA-specific adenosine deaminase n=2 Tax=Deinococcus carri TaxID=1211323 RepID=A0ABP9WG32_9DEIO
MHRCLALAETAKAGGDVPVGALVLLAGRVMGEGVEGMRTFSDPAAHAELAAVRAACHTLGTRDLSGAVHGR